MYDFVFSCFTCYREPTFAHACFEDVRREDSVRVSGVRLSSLVHDECTHTWRGRRSASYSSCATVLIYNRLVSCWAWAWGYLFCVDFRGDWVIMVSEILLSAMRWMLGRLPSRGGYWLCSITRWRFFMAGGGVWPTRVEICNKGSAEQHAGFLNKPLCELFFLDVDVWFVWPMGRYDYPRTVGKAACRSPLRTETFRFRQTCDELGMISCASLFLLSSHICDILVLWDTSRGLWYAWNFIGKFLN